MKVVITGKKIDMKGKKFNQLFVIEEYGKYRSEYKWKCKCNCGKEVIVRGHYLRSGHTKTCGNCIIYINEKVYMKCIVGSGRSFIFDIEDLNIVKKYKWSVDKYGYVLSKIVNGKTIKLHRLIMNPQIGEVVDHINGIPNDCRKVNLRVTTQLKNSYNSRIPKNNTSGYKGVCFDKKHKKYMAYIHNKGKSNFLGYFKEPREAAKAYNKAASYYFGEYARLNKIPKERKVSNE
jgi:hypothetical protein